LQCISGYFDTNVGPKVEAESYRRIVEQIGKEPSEVLFVTDAEKGFGFIETFVVLKITFSESFAAYEAGLQVRLTVREGNEPLSANALSMFKTLSTFDELFQ
jgi:methionine salvage enolase-phosphatase E1